MFTALLAVAVMRVEAAEPVFSTEGAPVWHWIQFNAGSNLLKDNGNGNNLKTVSVADRNDDAKWILVGDADALYLKSANGN